MYQSDAIRICLPSASVRPGIMFEQVVELCPVRRRLNTKSWQHAPQPLPALLLEADLTGSPSLELNLLSCEPHRPCLRGRFDAQRYNELVEAP